MPTLSIPERIRLHIAERVAVPVDTIDAVLWALDDFWQTHYPDVAAAADELVARTEGERESGGPS